MKMPKQIYIPRGRGPFLRDYTSKAPPLKERLYVPILRGRTYKSVNQLLFKSRKNMIQLGVNEGSPDYDPVLWWQALSNRRRWTPLLKTVWNDRNNALQIVVNELGDQVIEFRGLKHRFKYDPGHFALNSNSGGVVVDWGERPGSAHRNPFTRIGDPAFRSEKDLVRVCLHEGRHLWQSMQGGGFNRPTIYAEADAYLFDLKKRKLSGLNPIRIMNAMNDFYDLINANDRLATGKPIDPYYTKDISRGGLGVKYTLNNIERLNLELRWHHLKDDLHREIRILKNFNIRNRRFGESGLTHQRTFRHTILSPRPAQSHLRQLWGQSR